MDVAAEQRERRRQSEHVPASSSLPIQAQAGGELIGRPGPPQPTLAIPWRRVATGIMGLGMIGLGLLLLYVGIRPGCEDDPSGLCIGIASMLLVIGPMFALLGTPVVLAAVRRPGSIRPLVVAGCITLMPGIYFVFAAAVGEALYALVSFVVVVGMFAVAYLVAPREVSK